MLTVDFEKLRSKLFINENAQTDSGLRFELAQGVHFLWDRIKFPETVSSPRPSKFH